MSKANEIYAKSIKSDSKTIIINSMDFSYLVRMANALEKINEAQQKVYDGEYDGFDFGEKVEEILQSV